MGGMQSLQMPGSFMPGMPMGRPQGQGPVNAQGQLPPWLMQMFQQMNPGGFQAPPMGGPQTLGIPGSQMGPQGGMPFNPRMLAGGMRGMGGMRGGG